MNGMLGIGGVQARMAEIREMVSPQRSAPTTSFATALDALTTDQVAALAGTSDVSALLAQLGGTEQQQGPTAQDLIANARKYLGVPYVWGGSSSSGLDCSGLVIRALGDMGITDFPRVARNQQSMGTAVPSLSQAQPGDLLFFDNGRHVGIYLGDNRMIEAPAPGGKVRETAVWATPTAIRRILPQQQAAPAPVDTAAVQRALLASMVGVAR
ncbi:MAG: C40 family peptidase [Micrococcales bacterium]|nr:C40 family peptidase [Micrococcales bacterium]